MSGDGRQKDDYQPLLPMFLSRTRLSDSKISPQNGSTLGVGRDRLELATREILSAEQGLDAYVF